MMMKVLQIGAKNYPPAHGGTERVVYNIINTIKDIDFYLLVEWEQEENDRISVIPTKLSYLEKISFIISFVKRNNISIIHFHNEKYIPMALVFTILGYKNVLTVHGVHFRSPKFSFVNRFIFWFVDLLGTPLFEEFILDG